MLTPGGLTKLSSDPLLPRPMAVYRVFAEAGGAEVEFLYKVVGRGTTLLSLAEPGERVGVVGPLGQGFSLPPSGGKAIMVAGGTGVASVYELAVRACKQAEVTLLMGARSKADLGNLSDFEALPLNLEIATEDGSRGHCGLVTELMGAAGLDREEKLTIYACGPTPMMRAVAKLAADRGQRCFVSLENPMACGFGVCLGCAAPRSEGGFSLVCRDGPVFDACEIDWENL
jgi:dihydroorotate dehydrogenase electron transfer subunit